MASNPPQLVDKHGQPLRREVLKQEIAGPTVTGVRSIISGHPASGLTPQRLARLLLNAEQGDATAYFELAEEMEEKDLHYLSVLNTRKRSVTRIPITVEAADESAEAKADAELIETWLKRDTLRLELFDVLDAIGKGVSFVEIIWDISSSVWLPAKLKYRHPSWFEFDRVDGETPLLKNGTGQGEPLEFGKFIYHAHQAKSGLPVRGGLARAVAWGWMFKNYSIKDWVSFLEMYGQPIRVGRYDPGAHENDIAKLMRAVSQVGTDAAAVYPRTMDIEFIDGKTGTAPNELWRSMAEYIDDQVSKAVLGQTSSSDAKASGIGSGQSDLHGRVRDDIRDDDGDVLAATLNRDVVVPIVQFNRGPRKAYPRLKIEVQQPEDVKAKVDAAEKLVAMGVEVDAEEMRQMAGLPAPKSPDAKRLVIQSAGMPENSPQRPQEEQSGPTTPENAAPRLLDPLKSKFGGNGSAGRAAASALLVERRRQDDSVDIVTDELLSDWDELFEAAIDPIEEMLASSSSLTEAQAKLATGIGTMDLDHFAEILARAGFAAHLAGEIDAAADEEK